MGEADYCRRHQVDDASELKYPLAVHGLIQAESKDTNLLTFTHIRSGIYVLAA